LTEDFTRSNRALWAKKYNWPDGALETCNAIEDSYPEWHPLWSPGSDHGSRRRAGFYAMKRGWDAWVAPVFGATPEALVKAINDIEAEWRPNAGGRPARGTGRNTMDWAAP
jgi:hypothetical protein